MVGRPNGPPAGADDGYIHNVTLPLPSFGVLANQTRKTSNAKLSPSTPTNIASPSDKPATNTTIRSETFNLTLSLDCEI